MARLGDHPHVVTVYDAVEDDGALHIVARYMAGGSLAERLAAGPGGRLEVDEVLRTGRALADALAHAHEHGVVHRDVKPDNVWLAADGSAGLGDFGIAIAARRPGRRRPAPRPARRTTRRPSRRPARPRSRSPTSTRSAPRCGSCCAAGRRSPAPTPPRCSPSTATPSPSRRRATRPASRPGSTRSCSRCSPSGPATARATPPRCATRSTGSAARRACPSPPSPADREPLVGRDAELASLARRARGRARAGSARVVAIAGEPGIGKTRIVDEAAAEAGARGAAVVRGRADEESRAYGPWRAALRPLVAAASGLPARVLDDVRRLTGDGRAPEAAAGERRTARRSGCGCSTRSPSWSARRRASARCSIALEDVHAADRSSLALLGHLLARGARRAAAGRAHLPQRRARRRAPARRGARRARARPPADAAWRCTGCPRPPWRASCRRTRGRRRPRCARCTSAPPATRSSCASWCGCSPSAASCGGDGAELPALVPDRVREVVGRRLEPLEPATREVLAIAGVVGRPFTIAGVARVGGLRPRDRRPGARAGARRAARRGAPRRARAASASPTRSCATRSTTSWRPRCARACTRRSPPCCRSRCEAGGDATAAEAARHALAAARCGRRPAAGVGRSRSRPRARRPACRRTPRRPRTTPARSRRSSWAPRSSAGRAARDVARARGRRVRGRRHRAPRGAASAPSRPPRAGSARAEVQARAAIGFSEVQQYGAIDDGRDRAAAGGARRAAAGRQRAARAGRGAARPAARSR